MKLGHRSKGPFCPLAAALIVAIAICSTATALSIRREPVTEQVLIITTPDPFLQDEAVGGGDPATTIHTDIELRDEEAATTVDTMIVADTTGESWEVDPTVSSIVSKDVEIEIRDSTNDNINKFSESDEKPAGGPADDSKPVLPEIYSFHVQSDIKYRYSRTYITSRVANKDQKRAHEVTFSVVLPETAFISKFIMEIDGKSYEAYVKEKEEAKKVYNEAQSQGQSAGLVEKSTRNSNVFNVNVNIKPQTKVTFNLTYEELLTRRLGRYEQAININPDQVSMIKDYQILVNIEESRNLTFIRVPSLSNDIDETEDGNNPNVAIERPAPNKAKISWSPTTNDQKKLVKDGISGKFIVQYDVDRQSEAGQILVMQGYFVHFFAPENLPPLRKHVVFILDISGSMWGRKMEQLKESQKKILDDLTQDDFFNIITFSSDVYLWSPNDKLEKKSEFRQPSFPAMSEITPPELLARRQPLPATWENINKAKGFIDSLVASGGTNIHDAIIEALNLTASIKDAQLQASTPQPEPAIETTFITSSSTKSFTSTTSTSAPTTSATSTSSSTTTPSSSTQGIVEEEEENTSIVIVDIAKSEAVDFTERPEETAVSQPGHVVLPPNVQSLIIFLTDGEPTVGITDPPEIQRLIQLANRNLSIPIFSLGFGEGADFPFLKKLSLQNNGFGRKIYEASDAALQLKGFYNEIASPLLSNVTFNYTSEEFNITDITVTRFPTIFGGTEIAVAGKLVAPPKPERDDSAESGTIAPSFDAQPTTTTEDTLDDETPGLESDAPNEPNRLSISCDFEPSDRYFFDVSVLGNGRDGEIDLHDVEMYERRRKCGVGVEFPFPFIPPAGHAFPPRPTPPPSPEDQFLERLWAYLTIQQLIEQDLAQVDSGSKDTSSDVDGVTPTTTVAPDHTSIVTQVLPIQQVVRPSPIITRNVTKPETPKERALRLALKYGFVTPLTSLVVVKPNSSDVTNAVPTDARPDALDNFYAHRRISFAAPILRSASYPNIRMASMPLPPPPYISAPRSGGPQTRGYSANARHSSRYNSHSRVMQRKFGSSTVDNFPQSITAPQSMSVLALAAPASVIRHKIASQPLPLPIHANYLSRPSLPIPLAGHGGFGGHQGPPPPLFAAPQFIQHHQQEDSDDYDLSSAISSPAYGNRIAPTLASATTVYTTTATAVTSTTMSPPLSLDDIVWLGKDVNTIRLNETEYLIARNATSQDSAGYGCTNLDDGASGKCSHLQDCVLKVFVKTEAVFASSYFCSIQSQSSGLFAGVCCPSNRARALDIPDEDP